MLYATKKQAATNLRSAHEQNGPAGLDNGAATASRLLDLVDLIEGPLHRGSEVLVDVLEVLNEADLVAVATICAY